MREKINEILERTLEELKSANDSQSLDAVRVRVLGKKGELTGILRGMGQVAADMRPKIGQWVNEAREKLEEAIGEAQKKIAERELEKRLENEKVDVTMPVEGRSAGSLHPMSIVLEQLLDIFTGMGFEAVEGPEVELDHYNFELMNIPKNHPARDAQDTFYIDDNVVLRTHTSPVQARIMTTRKPPIRIVSFGRVYRADEADATHSPVFHQLEGLVIDENISMGDLKGTLDTFARRLYGEGVTTRFRPSFFPFTEPSAEVDLTCAACRGKGCRICKDTGWIEVLGSGMVNPKVLEMCGIDSRKYSGFAFGMGVERLSNLKYNVPDMRYLYENDVRFLRQFRG
ncbi:MAG: phenylalanine--tRNA ligase subunit alpha [Clostridia bacterium]|nr:phenylalanine--tRNA ligase subunit alpha [Clostridiales bacterium]MDO4828459.1 phenylalanine--tRNA ligase subunit alpha [Clostridia bacterium]